MSDRTVSITLQARDQITRTFDLIARDGDEMARRLVRDLEQVERQADQAERSARDLSKAYNDAKVGAVALGAAFTLASRSAVDEERSIRALRAAYGDASDDIIAFTEAIQDNTTFSNEQARAAAETASTLARNYGFTTDEIRQVLQASADLAAVTGFDLADATQRVTAALRGEAESAEALGLTMNQAAIDSEGLTLTMSNQEAAHFRLNALLEQAAFAQGQAAAATETTSGKVRQWQNTLQDATTDLVQMTGPVAQIAGALGEQAAQAALAAGGLVKLGQAAKEARVASVLAGAALSPGGLALGTVGAIAGISLLVDALTTGYGEAAGNAKRATDDLAQSIAALSSAGDPRSLLGQSWSAQLELAAGSLDDIYDRIYDLNGEIERLANQELGAVTSEAEQRAIFDRIAALEKQRDALQASADLFGGANEASREYAETQIALNAILTETGPAGDAARRSVSNYFALLDAGQIGLVDFMNAVQANAADLPAHNRLVIAFGESVAKAGKSAAEAGEDARFARDGWNALMASITRRGFDDAAQGAGRLDPLLQKMTDETADLRAEMEAFGGVRAFAIEAAVRGLTGGIVEMSAAAETASASLGVMFGPLSGTGIEASLRGLIPSMAELATAADPVESAFDRVARGSTSAAVALAAFKETQDGIIASQQPYTHQLSEYNTQLGFIEAALARIQEKQEAGIALTERETRILNESADAQARLEGGVEDATYQLAEQAIQYGENMTKGDQLNDTLGAQAKITGDLIHLVQLLIFSLHGIPPDVQTSFSMPGLSEALGGVQSLANTIAGLPSQKRIDLVVGLQNNTGLSSVAHLLQHGGMVGYQHGGMPGWPDLPGAQHGRAGYGGWFIAGEAGPEPVYAPGGYVLPNAAAQMNGMLDRGGGGTHYHFHINHLEVRANNPREFGRQLAQHRRMELRA